jgi:hypothetical protein
MARDRNVWVLRLIKTKDFHFSNTVSDSLSGKMTAKSLITLTTGG